MRLVIIGAGFAGMYAALSAARLREIQGVSPDEFEIALVAPEPTLVVRPRLYEPKPETLTAPLLDVLKAIDVVYVQGSVETIDTRSRSLQITAAKGQRKSLSYDRLVVATGSQLFRPKIPGLAEHGFSVDSLDDAVALDKHLHSLPNRPAVNGRDTVVVSGGGFTGIEVATEMPARLRGILDKNAKPRVIIVDRNKSCRTSEAAAATRLHPRRPNQRRTSYATSYHRRRLRRHICCPFCCPPARDPGRLA